MPRTRRGVGRPPALTQAMALEAAKWKGLFKTTKEICYKLKEQFGKQVQPYSVNNCMIAQKWKPVIDRFRQEYIRSVAEVPIFHDRVRLERLENIFQEIEGEEAKSFDVRKQLRAEKLAALREAREEIAKTIKGDTYNLLALQFQSMPDDKLLEVRDSLVQRIQTMGVSNGRRNGRAVIEPELQDVAGQGQGAGVAADGRGQ